MSCCRLAITALFSSGATSTTCTTADDLHGAYGAAVQSGGQSISALTCQAAVNVLLLLLALLFGSYR
jgi:hypothetical protein